MNEYIIAKMIEKGTDEQIGNATEIRCNKLIKVSRRHVDK